MYWSFRSLSLERCYSPNELIEEQKCVFTVEPSHCAVNAIRNERRLTQRLSVHFWFSPSLVLIQNSSSVHVLRTTTALSEYTLFSMLSISFCYQTSQRVSLFRLLPNSLTQRFWLMIRHIEKQRRIVVMFAIRVPMNTVCMCAFR